MSASQFIFSCNRCVSYVHFVRVHVASSESGGRNWISPRTHWNTSCFLTCLFCFSLWHHILSKFWFSLFIFLSLFSPRQRMLMAPKITSKFYGKGLKRKKKSNHFWTMWTFFFLYSPNIFMLLYTLLRWGGGLIDYPFLYSSYHLVIEPHGAVFVLFSCVFLCDFL